MNNRATILSPRLRVGFLGLLLVASSCLCASRLPGQPTSNNIRVGIFYYDLEGKAGYFYPGPEWEDPLIQGAILEIYRSGWGDVPPWWNDPTYVLENTLWADITLDEHTYPLGSFTFRCVVPAVGVFEGSGRIGNAFLAIGNLYYSLPVTHEAVGRPLSILGMPLTRTDPPNDIRLRVTVGVTNNHDFAGAVDTANTLGIGDRPSTLTIEYLPGNTLEGLGVSTIVNPNLNRPPLSLYWGTYYPPIPAGENICVVSQVAAVGPVRITLLVDGYETDSIETTLGNHMDYSWYSLIRARPDRPDAKQPSGASFRQVPISREVRRGILDVKARTHVLMDDNLDGAVDIADLIRARRSE